MNPKEFNIRTASNKDLTEIIFLVKKCLSEFGLTYSPDTSERDLNDIESSYINDGGTFKVLLNSNSEIIGTIALLKIDDRTCKLRKMYISQGYRKLGLGNLILEKIIEKAVFMGFKEIILETVSSMKAAIHIYKKYGFLEVQNDEIDSPRCDVAMRKVL